MRRPVSIVVACAVAAVFVACFSDPPQVTEDTTGGGPPPECASIGDACQQCMCEHALSDDCSDPPCDACQESDACMMGMRCFFGVDVQADCCGMVPLNLKVAATECRRCARDLCGAVCTADILSCD